MTTKVKLTLIALLVKYWAWLVRWMANWPSWAFYPVATVSRLLLLTSWGLTFPVDWIPVIDELITLKLAGLAAHALLVRHRILALEDEQKDAKKLRQRNS